MSKNRPLLTGMETPDQINKAISITNELFSGDGRLFKVISWRPYVRAGETVTIQVEMYVVREGELNEDINN